MPTQGNSLETHSLFLCHLLATCWINLLSLIWMGFSYLPEPINSVFARCLGNSTRRREWEGGSIGNGLKCKFACRTIESCLGYYLFSRADNGPREKDITRAASKDIKGMQDFFSHLPAFIDNSFKGFLR